MRKGLLSLSTLFVAVTSLTLACGAQRRSSFTMETDPSDPGYVDNGFGTPVEPKENDDECSSSQTEIERVPVVIEFVVDESGSMDSSSYGVSKWRAARDALLAAFDDMNTIGDPATFVGVMRYSDGVRGTVKPDTFANPQQHDRLVDLIDTNTAGGGGTATDVALQAAYSIVQKFKPPASSGLDAENVNRVVVLLSDGVPNGGVNGQQTCENLVGEMFEETPPNGPILTFAVGIGEFPSTSSFSYDPAFMGRVAQRGGTAPQGCDPSAQEEEYLCHFQVTPGTDSDATKQALLDAINKIRELSASCSFSFTTNSSTDLGKVTVTITDKDGTVSEIAKDSENGWTFDNAENPTQILLHGDACSASTGTMSGRVDVVIGCRGAN